jgi:hypothetical protein
MRSRSADTRSTSSRTLLPRLSRRWSLGGNLPLHLSQRCPCTTIGHPDYWRRPWRRLKNVGSTCFVRMPEGLKNVRSTFSRLTKRILEDQMGHNVFTYVDDIVVASKTKKTIYLTSQKHSLTCVRPNFAWTRRSAYLESGKTRYLVTMYRTEGLKQTQEKSRLSWTRPHHNQPKISNGWQED